MKDQFYTLRFPFQLKPGREFSGLEGSFQRETGGLQLRIHRKGSLHIFEVQGFNSEESAKECINRLWAGLIWATLNRGLAFTAVLEPQQVSYTDDPQKAAENLSKTFKIAIDGPVDALIDGHLPAVYRSDKSVRVITLGTPTVTITSPFEEFIGLVIQGMELPNSQEIISDTRLRTALDLYVGYFSENSANARLLTLVMALEALTTPEPKPKLALDLLSKWQTEVQQLKGRLDQRSDDYAALEALERELIFRKESSIRNRIRVLVRETLNSAGSPAAEDFASRAAGIYDKRSTLIHEGQLPTKELQTAESDAKEIVEMVLKARFQETANR